MSTHPHNRRVAVVGGGISGLAAAWALGQRHEVTLFEAQAHLGGHANTVDIVDEDNTRLPVDTGFIVYNERNYPHLIALFDQLDVNTAPSDMSFAVSLDDGRTEYSGSGLNGLFAQRRNTVRPRFWVMLRDIARFYRSATAYLGDAAADCTIGELLERERYSSAFIDDHLVPMAAAIWSASRDDITRYPAEAFIRFFDNHGLLTVAERPQWRTVRGGSREYVRRLLLSGRFSAHRNVAVRDIRRMPDGIRVACSDGQIAKFDDIVLASHPDQALGLLGDADGDERAVLGAFEYSRNDAWLHEDVSLMPRRRAAWASWNYLQARLGAGNAPLSVSYWMNRLQPLDTVRNVFVTLNPRREPDAATVHGRYSYSHPVFTPLTAQAQTGSAAIQGRRNTWFCGAWLGHGFHEDGLQSGLWVAGKLGAPAPWAAASALNRLPPSYGGSIRHAA